MNQLTTLAAIPSGGGSKSTQPAEVGKKPFVVPAEAVAALARHGYRVDEKGFIVRMDQGEGA